MHFFKVMLYNFEAVLCVAKDVILEKHNQLPHQDVLGSCRFTIGHSAGSSTNVFICCLISLSIIF